MTGKSAVNGTEPGLSTTGGLLLVIATILLLGALSWGEMVFAPAAFAIFIVMVVWPLQAWLQTRMPKSLAIVITILVTVVSIVALLLLFVWGMSVVGQWLIRNGSQFQTLYKTASDWLEGHGLPIAGQMTDMFSMSWIVGMVQTTLSRLNGLAGFAMLVFAFAVFPFIANDFVLEAVAIPFLILTLATIGLNVLNLLDQKGVTDVYRRANRQNLPIPYETFFAGFDTEARIDALHILRDPQFLQPNAWQPARDVRVSFKRLF